MKAPRSAVSSWLVALALVLVLAACSSPPAASGDGGPCALDVEWGRSVGGAFAPYLAGESAELILGFQGFLFLETTMKVRGTRERICDLGFQIGVDGHDTRTQEVLVELTPAADGASYATQVLVFFNDVPMADLVGRSANIVATSRAGACAGRYTTSVVLRNSGSCFSDPDGSVSCADGGRP